MIPLQRNIKNSRYQAMIGVGGIGTGTFFELQGNTTLGREESRLGRFLDRRDYCKLHIVAHYVKTLLGPEFVVKPVGKVGDDTVGKELIQEMQNAGLDLNYVQYSPGHPTLSSFCIVYPDGSGGNLTTDDSACSQVDARAVEDAEEAFLRFQGHGVALAMPEVPLAARERLLQLGRKHQLFCVASFVSDELPSIQQSCILQQIDLLALNRDEAAAVSGVSAEETPTKSIVEQTVATLTAINPALQISITAGKQGSWVWDGVQLSHSPGLDVQAKSTAGAGDAHLSGLVAGITAGLTLSQAQELATLVAALSVTSEHTINKTIDARTLNAFADSTQAVLCDAVRALLAVSPL